MPCNLIQINTDSASQWRSFGGCTMGRCFLELGLDLLTAGRTAYSPPPPSDSALPLSISDDFSAFAIASWMQQLIDDLPEQIALLDSNCRVIAANGAWKCAVQEHGYFDLLPGGNYHDFCLQKATEGYDPAIATLSALDGILRGDRTFWQYMYRGRDQWRDRHYQLTLHRMGTGRGNLISVTRSDLTELFELRRGNAEREHFAQERQDLERKRMARELHDSTGQLLTGIGLLLCRLENDTSEAGQAVVSELQTLVREAGQEIRLISYLASPPEVEKLGLVDALKSLVEGFGRRTSLEATFELCGQAADVPDAEGALYRVAQEALSNLNRHAHAARARVTLCFRQRAVHLLVVDDGVGLSPDALNGSGAGVGLASMRARLAEIGGRLSIRQLEPGTAILASVRIPECAGV